MAETSKSYRIRTDVGIDNNKDYITVSAELIQDYDTFEVLSVGIKSKDAYQLHNSNYGVVVGRVLANNGFGIPNAKISIFIKADVANGFDVGNIYPFNSSIGKDKNGVRYNLLPNERVDGCHQVVGTFPTKRYALDNDVILEVFEDYYTYTTKTNNAGDYMICGVPVGNHTIHMDLDLSDCGILSQKPRDFVYKGYTIEQFETPTKFKGGTDYNNLSQIFTQDQVVNVNPFWGNSDLGETIGVSRCDIDVNFKFEPTCVFMGSIVSDNSSNGFSKKCVPTEAMGYMDELVTGEGKIEMIRKTPGGSVEEFQIKGNKLINANGVWCYQIPMNLDYMVTDEYGNMVPTDNPEKGIPTRASVRFRLSMEDSEENTDNFFRAKVLVPHNPQVSNGKPEGYDYEFGTYTKDESFRDLFWNNVYSVKSYIPRIQRSNNWRKEKFSGIKHCNKFGQNNPMPYNNIRIKLPLMFTIMCAILKIFVFLVKISNTMISIIGYVLAWLGTHGRFIFISTPNGSWGSGCGFWSGSWVIGTRCLFRGLNAKAKNMHLITLKDGLCPDLENWYFAPLYKDIVCPSDNNCLLNYAGSCKTKIWINRYDPDCTYNNLSPQEWNEIQQENGQNYVQTYNILAQTISYVLEHGSEDDPHSIDDQNADPVDETHCLTTNTDYLLPCIEMNLAQEYNVINFDFYNDWINGVIYNPRWVRYIKKKTRFLWITWAKEKVKGCMDDTKIFGRQRKYVQQCAVGYKKNDVNGYNIITKVDSPINTKKEHPHNQRGDTRIIEKQIIKSNNFHKKNGFKVSRVFGRNGGVCHESTTLKGQKVYYLKPCEFNSGFLDTNKKKTNLYATDIILLGTFNDCDLNGIPKTFTHLTSTTYIMPTNLALTNMDTNGPLYATNQGTICVGNLAVQGVSEYEDADTLSSGITEVTQTSNIKEGEKGPLERELMYYQNSKNYSISDNTFFNDATANDTIALTEAAGISWDYTGPGQGIIIKDRMYYPGGHFLGLTCVNSQTNIKSCLNLSRICEIGTNMSQRREEVREIGSNGFKFTYTAPSGFISGDEISDSDFRAMFATLNKKRLIATKRNKQTGYRFYDFEFANPINFDGAFYDILHGDYLSNYNENRIVWPYNQNVPVIEEDLSLYGVLKGMFNDDYDSEESGNTQTRTRESSSVDYYLYRFGIGYNDLNNLNVESKFLLKNKSSKETEYTYYLPQYENSYYFYFGLREGATALDEFNKQFYSECDEIKINQKPHLILATELNFCDATGTIHIITEGLSVPYQRVTVENRDNGETYNVDATSDPHEVGILSMESFHFPDVENPREFVFGRYTVTVLDDDDVEISEDINIGTDLFDYDVSIVNFTKPVYGDGIIGERTIYQGGFVFIENFECYYDGEENVEYYFRLYLEGTPIGEYEFIDEFGYTAYGIAPYIDYDLCIVWRCEGGEEHVLKLETIMFQDNRDIDLILGYDDIYAVSCLSEQGNFNVMRYMSEDFWFDNSYNVSDYLHETDTLRWFLRKMFFKESNLTAFNSHVNPTNGCRKVLWGAPQRSSNSMIDAGGYSHIYCSERYIELPSGTFLDDTNVTKPTYGANYCQTMNDNEVTRYGDDDNCTFQFCAQAYRETDAGGEYRGTYNRYEGLDLNENYFHVGYGCVFKPLPYGNLMFFEYNGIEDLFNTINTSTSVNFGVIYPTFIYPVMKRPFYGSFTMRIFNDFNVNIVEEYDNPIYSFISKEYLSNALLGIHNGVTYNRHFGGIQVFSRDFGIDENVLSADTYDVTLSTNVDRVYDCNTYEHDPTCLTDGVFKNLAAFTVTEGYPRTEICGYDASLLAKNINVYQEYEFYDNLFYRLSADTETSSEKIINVFGNGTSDENTDYYIGYYDEDNNNVQLLVEPNNSVDKKYAYSIDSHGNYIVLCRFFEDSRIFESQWYSDVFVKVRLISDTEVLIQYNYIDIYGHDAVYDDFVLIDEPDAIQNLSHPYGINQLLDNIKDGKLFMREIQYSGIALWETMPFIPVMNYKVLNGNDSPSDYQPLVAYGTEYFGPNFKSFIQKLIVRGNLRPIDHCESLQVGNLENKHIFGIGVKTIMSNEDNEVISYIYKVYPNPFRNKFYGDAGDYSLIIEPPFYNAYGNFYMYGKGKSYKDVYIDVHSYPCTVLLAFENNASWCYFVYDGLEEYGSKEFNYVGYTIHIKLWVASNDNDNDRNCILHVQSYYGGVRDTVNIVIKQKGRLSSPSAIVSITQTYPEQIPDEDFLNGQSYSYRLRISAQYSENNTDNYVKIRPDGFGAIKDNPYTPIFHNENYVPNEIVLTPGNVFDRTFTVNNCNDARYHIPMEMYESTSEILDIDSDYNVTEIRYDYF